MIISTTKILGCHLSFSDFQEMAFFFLAKLQVRDDKPFLEEAVVIEWIYWMEKN